MSPGLRILCVESAILIVAAQLGAQGSAPQQKLRVAVMDLSGSALKMQTATTGIGGQQPMGGPPGQVTGQQTTTSIAVPPPAEFARGLTEMLTSVLVKTGRFSVLERAAMQQIEQEQAMSAAGKTTKETGARQGAIMGAQLLITGDITGFAFNRSSLGGKMTNFVKGLSVSSEKVTAEVHIDLRLIDPSTSEVIYSAKGVGRASQTGIAAELVRDEKSWSADAQTATPLGQASRQAIQNVVVDILFGMPKVRWSGRVIDVRGGVAFINAAAADGMRVGLELQVFEAQPALVDPGSGKALGAPERLVGTLTIETVQEKYSTAKITKGEGIARGFLVRFKEE